MIKEFDFYPFELTDIWDFNWLHRLYLEFKVSNKTRKWTTYGFYGFLRDIFEVKRDEIELIEVSKDDDGIFLIFAIENTYLIEPTSNLQVDDRGFVNDYVEVPSYEPIH